MRQAGAFSRPAPLRLRERKGQRTPPLALGPLGSECAGSQHPKTKML